MTPKSPSKFDISTNSIILAYVTEVHLASPILH